MLELVASKGEREPGRKSASIRHQTWTLEGPAQSLGDWRRQSGLDQAGSRRDLTMQRIGTNQEPLSWAGPLQLHVTHPRRLKSCQCPGPTADQLIQKEWCGHLYFLKSIPGYSDAQWGLRIPALEQSKAGGLLSNTAWRLCKEKGDLYKFPCASPETPPIGGLGATKWAV